MGASCEGVAWGWVGLLRKIWCSRGSTALQRALLLRHFMLWVSFSITLAVGYLGRRLLSLRRRAARLKWVPLGPNLGVQACELSPSTVAGLSWDDPRLCELGEALREHSLLRLRRVDATEPPLTPQQLRDVYTKVHRACHPSVPLVLPKPRANATTATSPMASMAAMAAEGSDQRVHASAHHSGSDPRARRNLRGETFSDFPETNVLGFAEDVSWHGLRGRLEPTAWWEKIGCH